MTTDSDAELAICRESPFPRGQWRPMCRHRTNLAAAEATFEFGRFRVLLRQRQLVADGVPIELGARAFDLLLGLLEADGSLVSKDALLSRVWPGIVVSEENLKVQIFALRKALGEDRDFIRTEFGRGYRFTAAIRSTSASSVSEPPGAMAPVASKIGSSMDFSSIGARPGSRLAAASVRLTVKSRIRLRLD
jgi:DNA-binding winged helix-turn-helix (wHTH) protein